MSDPEPLLENSRSVEALLLDSARDDAPPPELLGRTLAKVGIAGASAAVAGASATTASAAPAAATTGLLGAIGIGALAGLLAVGIIHQVWTPAEPPQSAPGAAVSAASAPSEPRPLPAREPDGVATAAPTSAPSDAAPGSSGAMLPLRSTTSAAPLKSTLPAELALIDEARAALASGDRARARASLDRYAREFPSGQLAHEAGVLRAELDGSRASGASIP